ncbi:ATP-binding protein [Candidatus Methylospira mobilis]|uniref:ATP-binding protein n=1 Tax=Candidatus Methylospira mobilis TaxID=1808979 RepID=UPI0028F15453|nr:ATP-binding protein [Candidatus Methylospira mobilis]WNV04255.1 ATP-binding protein [Candidatus Methylospira mobilis]
MHRHKFFFGTLRGRLILSVAAIHAVMMSLFITDLTLRQRVMLLDRQVEEAEALTQSLSTSAAGWIAAADVSGIQEIVETQRRYPELIFAMVVDNQGLVLAHTDPSRMGKYLLDLPHEVRQTMLSKSPALVDVAVPAMLGSRHVGWARVGIGQKAYGEKLTEIIRNGVLYAVATILIGSTIAWSMGRRITRRLYAVQETIDAVRTGNRQARSPIAGTDEAAVMAKEFNAMLDALAKQDEKLRNSEARYRCIVDTATEGIWVVGPDLKTVFVNARITEILGYGGDEIMGRPMMDFLFDEDKADHLRKMQNRQMGISEHYERRFRHKNGDTVWMLTSATPIIDEENGFNGAFSMLTDITERRQAEEELRRYKDQLEQTVLQRTAELLLARDAAEAASKAKSLFLANMSHELRTPLNAILGFSQMMRRDPNASETQRENLNIINRSGEHLLSLINDVLEIAKIEAGRLQLEVAPFDLGSMVRDVTEMMRLRAQEKGLQLLLDQTSEFPRYIKSDEARLRQVLVNLVSNAIKFTAQGVIIIRLGVKNNTRKHLLMEVEDTGPGIKPEDQKRLFKPFVQLAESGMQKGTGLGLAISRQFVELMGGHIGVESAVGKGSLFRVELPVELAALADILKAEKRGEVVALAPGQPAYRILIAEDQHENQLLLSRLMTAIGLEVKIAENGAQCVKLFQDWHPDLIWMDRRMPVMDGMEATRRIRLLADGQAVKIVAVTASAFQEQRQETLDAGMDDFVRKPYRFEEIYGCLARQLGVRYLYRSELPEEAVPDVLLTAGMLAVLTPELRHELGVALESLDDKRISAAIQQIGKVDLQLSRTLSRLTDSFDYPAILGALADTNRRFPQ